MAWIRQLLPELHSYLSISTVFPSRGHTLFSLTDSNAILKTLHYSLSQYWCFTSTRSSDLQDVASAWDSGGGQATTPSLVLSAALTNFLAVFKLKIQVPGGQNELKENPLAPPPLPSDIHVNLAKHVLLLIVVCIITVLQISSIRSTPNLHATINSTPDNKHSFNALRTKI